MRIHHLFHLVTGSFQEDQLCGLASLQLNDAAVLDGHGRFFFTVCSANGIRCTCTQRLHGVIGIASHYLDLIGFLFFHRFVTGLGLRDAHSGNHRIDGCLSFTFTFATDIGHIDLDLIGKGNLLGFIRSQGGSSIGQIFHSFAAIAGNCIGNALVVCLIFDFTVNSGEPSGDTFLNYILGISIGSENIFKEGNLAVL